MSLPTGFAAVYGLIFKDHLFPDGFAGSSKWFHEYASWVSPGWRPGWRQAARSISARIERAAQMKSRAPSVVVTAAESRE